MEEKLLLLSGSRDPIVIKAIEAEFLDFSKRDVNAYLVSLTNIFKFSLQAMMSAVRDGGMGVVMGVSREESLQVRKYGWRTRWSWQLAHCLAVISSSPHSHSYRPSC
jgi:hypothetical protein